MSSSEQAPAAANSAPPDDSLRMAVAISLLRSKRLQRSPSQNSDALRWKRKAKERKQELLRLRQDLKEAEDSSHCDLFPQSASCKCYFFDNLGKLSPNRLPEASQCRFNDVLRRRFLRHVRFKERRRRTAGSSSRRYQLSDMNSEDEMELLRASVDFLVELCETDSPVEEASFLNWSHQAVDFILASLKNLLSTGKNVDLIEGIVSSLITRMITRICCPFQGNAKQSDYDGQFFVQHLIRKLGTDPYFGQRALYALSQRVAVLAENFLFTDPFDEAFTNMHQCMFILIQLIEFLVSDYLSVWSKDEGFETGLFEEWVASVLHARKALELLESRNGLYALYMDRVIGELVKQVSLTMSLQKIKREILDKLFH
ncbi:protein MULTIPOLAR SPINDLE 1 isoform X2 [Argentina anserina]|uniref:protein MULTIPOLAR SPINDLE 1 isoform X2 n=1 Tax=Argentina anserina TaxID=57926 RepID=UPI002176598A|nr:protein MULTIPOLAR SPINDLE 1 isoform X2 [Potentilla anserina]